MVIAVMGLPGSGKSYFAARLATSLHADYISSDKVRKALLYKRTYSKEEKDWIYDKMVSLMRQSLNKHKNIVLDATFYKEDIRQKFIHKIMPGDEIIFIEVVANESLIQQRLKRKRINSEADFKVYKIIQSEWEPLQQPHLTLHSTNDNIDAMLHLAAHYLQAIHHG